MEKVKKKAIKIIRGLIWIINLCEKCHTTIGEIDADEVVSVVLRDTNLPGFI